MGPAPVVMQRPLSVTVTGFPTHYDFSLEFEEMFFSILPSALLLILVPARLWFLQRRAKRVCNPRLQLIKMVRDAPVALIRALHND